MHGNDLTKQQAENLLAILWPMLRYIKALWDPDGAPDISKLPDVQRRRVAEPPTKTALRWGRYRRAEEPRFPEA